MLVIKEKNEAYVALFYQVLHVDTISRRRKEVVWCEALQIKKLEIFESLCEVAKIFSKTLFDSLNTHDQMKYAIDLIKEKTSSTDCVYNMSHDELSAIREYIANALKKNWIHSFSNLTRASVLFVKKSDESLRLCVNYRKLNEVIVKNKYSLFLLSKTLKRFARVKHFIKIDIRNAYHRIRIRKNDEWKTTFRTRYEQFEY